jgi:catechol-2,3-dioxygenase
MIVAVRAVEFSVTDIERSTKFYSDAFALEAAGAAQGARYFRASGPDHHVLVLRSGEVPGIASVELSVADRAGVDTLRERLARRGCITSAAALLDAPGGGYGFSLIDGSGRHWRFVCDVEPHAQCLPAVDRPFKVSHVVLNTADIAQDVAFAVEELGFRVRDESRAMVFLGCNADHHSLAFAKAGNVALNHVAFEVPTIDALMRGAGRMKRTGFPMQWGVGRHGPGANVYSYFLDPDGIPVEYTTDIMQVDDTTYRPGTPADWERPPFYDAWGLAAPPTQAFLEASAGLRPMPGVTGNPSEWRSSWRTM